VHKKELKVHPVAIENLPPAVLPPQIQYDPSDEIKEDNNNASQFISEDVLNLEKNNRFNNRPGTATSKGGNNGAMSMIMGTIDENLMFGGRGIPSDDEKQTNKGFTRRKSMLAATMDAGEAVEV
jgi:hypothetical protein